MKFEMNELLKINFMFDGNFDILNVTSNIKFNSILDIGLGEGGASTYFALKGKKVTALGLDIENYNYLKKLFAKLDVEIIKTTLKNFKIRKVFDAIWASNILEHQLNVEQFLNKCNSLLNDHGWLCIMIPSYDNKVLEEHINNGWNMGQLMYNLLLAGYNIKHGHFIKHGYNTCAFVQKTKKILPQIRMDLGDMEAIKELWPLDVRQGFDGNIDKINWFEKFQQYEKEKDASIKQLEFDDSHIKVLLDKVKNNVELEKNNLLKNAKNVIIKTKPAFQNYQESRIENFMQNLKKIPILGKSLLWFKHKVLAWTE